MIKKEIIVAVIIGLFISLLIGGGIYRAKQVFNQHQTKTKSSPNPSTTTEVNLAQDKQNHQLFLKITSPQNNSVSKKNTITLTGETLPNTYIAIVTDKSEYLIVPNKIGQFSQQIKLIKGANLIKITVYTKTGEHQSQTLNLVYTDAKI